MRVRPQRPNHRLIETLETRKLLASVPAGFIDEAFGPAISNGTAMEFAPDGRLFVLTQTGTVYVVQPGTGAVNTALTLPVDSFFERGLLGIAFDPDFASNQQVYLYWTDPNGASPSFNKVVRYTVSGNTINAATGVEILRLDNLNAGNHNGGAIHFGSDGKLYVAVGDNAVGSNAQSLANRHGKILRINKDGTIPADNPTSFAGVAGTTSGANRAIYALGLRNPFTFHIAPNSGRIYINDVGQNTWEEVNLLAPGLNYGWPSTEGGFNSALFPNFTQPLYYYGHGSGSQRGYSIIGGIEYDTDAAVQFPAQFHGKYFFGDYVNDWIGYVDPANPPAAHSTSTTFATGTWGLVDMKIGPDGAIYYLQRSSGTGSPVGVRRIRVDTAIAPQISDQPDSLSIFDGETATFTVTAGGAGTLSYQWMRNGVDMPGENQPTLVLTNVPGSANGDVFRVRVSNNNGVALSDPAILTVNVNAAPQPTISSPNPLPLIAGGETVNFGGYATDLEDGTIPPGSLFWRVDYYTGGSDARPFVPEFSGAGGSFVPHTRTPYTLPDVFYRIVLRAVDSRGRESETFVDLFPRTADITLAAAGVPGPIDLTLDGQPQTAPHVFTGVVGVIREIGAPASVVFDGQTYQFQNWSDAGSLVHEISTPETDSTYTANYLDITAPLVNSAAFDVETSTHLFEIRFSEDVGSSLSINDFSLMNLTTNTPVELTPAMFGYDANGRVATITPGDSLPTGRYRLSLNAAGVTDSVGNSLTGTDAFEFTFIPGDADQNGTVDFADLLTVARHFGTGGRTFSEGNFDYDAAGHVDFSDLLLLAKNFGVTLFATQPIAKPPRGAGIAGDVLADTKSA